MKLDDREILGFLQGAAYRRQVERRRDCQTPPTGDHKGPPHQSRPPSPLRSIQLYFVRLMLIGPRIGHPYHNMRLHYGY